MVSKHVSILKSFIDGDAQEWFQRFEISAAANEWTAATKLLKLPTLLEGEALAVWLELSTESSTADYAISEEKSDQQDGAYRICLIRRISLSQASPRRSCRSLPS